MAKPDEIFRQTFAWYKASLERALAASGLSGAQQAQIEPMVWQMLGVSNPGAPPVNPDLGDFKDSGANAQSLAQAAQLVGESLVALEYVRTAVAALQGGNPAAALAVIRPVLEQLERLHQAQPGSRLPSAFSIGKMLLALSGDATASPAAGHEADKLALLLGASGAAAVENAQTVLGLVVLLVGAVIDRAFTATSGAAGWTQQALPNLAGVPTLALSVPGKINTTLAFGSGAQAGVKARLGLSIENLNAGDLTLSVKSTAGASLFLPIGAPGGVSVDTDLDLDIGLARASAGGALVIGSDALGVKLTIGELGVELRLKNDRPRLGFFARKGRATIAPTDPFLQLILGNGVSFDFAIEAEADRNGALRLTNGTGLRASLPVPTLPTGPFSLQLITLGLAPQNDTFVHLQVELSASFGVELGPFAASIDRLGVLLDLDPTNGTHPIGFSFKPPNGIGLSLDAGIVKGGGFLGVDGSGYSGVLELKLLAISVKAIAILDTKSEAGFSLLLLIFGQFPAIQLSFGFTLTGVGGLIGVQHTASPTALSQGIANGSLDAVLFPDNPVGDAPRIINTLRTLFPVKRGGFVIGPMFELGWGTPSLLTVRLGLLVEADQFVLLGQGIVQLPPAVSADLALLYLRMDFVGSVVFDPLRIAFDAKLVNSRVAFISLTGQFAFRAEFGSQPTFLISAGGFHPRFKEIPSDIPVPFDRVGASFDIGIVGISFKGYFAITSATIQAGSDLRIWADLGIAGIEGGWGFDAICYLVPKFYFEVDLHAYLAVHVFGKDFASVHLEGTLAGPGRWHIVGRAKVHTPWPLPDFSVHIDEAWGTDRDTPKLTVDVAEQLGKEIGRIANWSAQLPKGGEAFLSLADIKAGTDLLAHPLGTLAFQQKLIPLELRLDKASGSGIKGANEFFSPALKLSQQGNALPQGKPLSTKHDFFAAAQFLEMSQDDRMAKPSFETFAAGYELGDDSFELGSVVPETLDYEEADLAADRLPRRSRRIGQMGFSEEKHGALMRFGAAGLSPLRDRALMQPAQPADLRVGPAPLVVANKGSLQVVSAETHASFWRAEQTRKFAAGADAVGSQVVEMAEVLP